MGSGMAGKNTRQQRSECSGIELDYRRSLLPRFPENATRSGRHRAHTLQHGAGTRFHARRVLGPNGYANGQPRSQSPVAACEPPAFPSLLLLLSCSKSLKCCPATRRYFQRQILMLILMLLTMLLVPPMPATVAAFKHSRALHVPVQLSLC